MTPVLVGRMWKYNVAKLVQSNINFPICIVSEQFLQGVYSCSSLLRIVHRWTAEQTLLQQLDLTLPWVCTATCTSRVLMVHASL